MKMISTATVLKKNVKSSNQVWWAACMSKTCSKCKETYLEPEKCFHRHPMTRDGLHSQCKRCKNSGICKAKRVRRDERRNAKLKDRGTARAKAREHYQGASRMCAVLNCAVFAEELHHVNYSLPLDVIPLCAAHHRMNHELCKVHVV